MTTGIRTIEDLRGRCWVDDITGCWHYKGYSEGGQPALWVPLLGKTTTMGVAISVLVTGAAPKKGVFWHCKCDTPGCANPDHRKPGSRSSQMKAAKITRSPLTVARMSRGKMKLTAEQIELIRTSPEPAGIVAEQLGISRSLASRYRRQGGCKGVAAPGSSVFNFAGWER
jgi:hypothetical protein